MTLLWGIMIGLSLFSWEVAAQQRSEVAPEYVQSPGVTADGEPYEMVEHGELSPPDETTALFSFGLILIGGLFWGSLRWYQRTPQVRRQRRQQVIVSMAALDDRYARGEITEQRYRQTRQRLKQQAIQLT